MAEKKLKVAVLNMNGEEVSSLALNKDVFGIEVNKQVMFDAVKVYLANRRQATAKVKNRSEVSGGGKKPWRQKGTGRARAGSTRSPIWVGGGRSFGPRGNQNYKISQNKKEHRLALKSALTLKAVAGLVVVDRLEIAEPKTKLVASVLSNIKVTSKALVVTDANNANLALGIRNINKVKLVNSNNVSVYDLLNAKQVVFDLEAIKKVMEVLG